MKTIIEYLIILVVLIAFLGRASAQTVSNVNAIQVGTFIHITYDLDRAADISVYISTNRGEDFVQLSKVRGDVGDNVSAGHNTIVWDVLAEQEELIVEDIVFKVKAQASDILTFDVNGVTFKMIYVEGGTFNMGSTSGKFDEMPVHSVTLSDFCIGETEVTQALWKAVMGYNPSFFCGDSLPVENVRWIECQNFIQRLNELTGKLFRLPTEAEWEYAACEGKYQNKYEFSGGDNIGEMAWYEGNSEYQTHPVNSKKPNVLGVYDMSGNVSEWCFDWYGAYHSVSQINPRGAYYATSRVIRGGNWRSRAQHCTVTIRNADSPTNRNKNIGFRLVLIIW